MPTNPKVTLTLTETEAEALLCAALAGQYEYVDTVKGDPGRSAQAKTATAAALDRAITKLRDA